MNETRPACDADQLSTHTSAVESFATDHPSANDQSKPMLSIVIPNYNGWHLLHRCLKSLKQHAPANVEIIVVDDGSSDASPAKVRWYYPDVTLIEMPENGGFCKAANTGARAATADVVELLNNDAEVTADWFVEPLKLFADRAVGVVAPLVRQLPYRTRIDSAGDEYFLLGYAKKRFEGKPVDLAQTLPRDVFGASASSAFYRRTVLLEVGGFPEHYGAYLDDVDLSFRIKHHGYRCLFTPASVVFHWVSQTHRVHGRRVQAQVARNSELLFWSNTSRTKLLLLIIPHGCYLIVQLAYKVLKGDFGAWLGGKLSLLAMLPTVWRDRKEVERLTTHAQTIER